MEKLLQHYLKRLTNLAGSNRSLLLLRLIRDQFIDLHSFDYAINQPSFDLIKSLIANKKMILCGESDPRDHQSNALSHQLKKLNRTQEFIFQERGSRDLYIGWPFVEGRFQDNTLVRCPLLFFPIQLSIHNKHWQAEIRSDINVTFNKTFLLAYSFYNQIPFDENLVETVVSELDTDSTVFRTQLYELLKDSYISLNFNQDVFLDQLIPFIDLRKDSFQKKTKTGQLKLQSQAILGIFPQSGSYLVPDYLKLLEEGKFEDLESFFESRIPKVSVRQTKSSFSDRVKEENTYTPFSIDAYQEEALQRIKKGESLTIQGPPGSGKSQLIANLISDFVARGKNVLLICQKKAALDVVFERLKSKSLHDFVGMVHDFKSDRKAIFNKIENQIDRLDEYKQKNNGLDTIQLERTHTQSSREIESIVEELDEFKHALFDTDECGKSIKELYLISDPQLVSISVKSILPVLTYDQLPDYLKRLRQYFLYFLEYNNKRHFWAHEKSFADYSNEDRLLIKRMLADMQQTFHSFQSESQELLHKELDYDAAEFFLRNEADLQQLITNIDHESVYRFFLHMLDHKPSQSGSWLVDLERTIMRCFKGEGMESSLQSEELGRFQESLQRAIKARKNPWSYLRWRFFSKDQIFISRVLVANELKNNKESFDILLQKIDNRLNYEHNVSTIEEQSWLSNYPSSLRKLDIQNWFFFSRLAFKSTDLFHSLRNLDAYIKFIPGERKAVVKKLSAFHEIISKLPDHKIHWNQYLTDHQVREILSNRVDIQKINAELDRDFENLRDYHRLKASYSTTEKNIIAELENKESSLDEKIKIFENSVALTWIDHIETKYPVLRMVSTLRFDELIHQLRDAIQTKKNVSRDILLLRSRERTLENLEFNRLQNRLTYRELHHQVTKKKQIWPLRRVISEFKDEVFKLVPCWMTSPESASAIFPMEELFDLVIFDEASQCFTERGIPGMVRGKQVVIAGDSQQLKPFDLYRVRWEDEEEDSIEFEKDALLDLSAQYLPEVHLQGHYRSESLELIDFSNRYFYGSRLQAIPGYTTIKDSPLPFDLVNVGGKWENNSNKSEAEEVIRQIQLAHSRNPKHTIGVVTFNAPQQHLIWDLMESRIPAIMESGSNIFVKNIENVQGDERDIIIFSTGYAKDEKGKLQLRFGTLNQSGGEHRLNVAISRARKKIILITSIRSTDIKADQAKNEGPKLFKLYLQYVEQIVAGQWKSDNIREARHVSDWYLKNRIIQEFEIDQRYDLNTQLPFTDVTVTDTVKNGFAGLIRTDDELYYDARSVKDIYTYQPGYLTKKGWPHFQAHSRQMWNNPSDLGDRLRLFIHRIAAFDQSST